MNKIGLFFGTDTGNTETVAESMVESLKELTGQDIVTAGVGGALFSGVLTTMAITRKNVLKRIQETPK